MADWLKSSTISKIVTDHWVKDLEATVARLSSEHELGRWKIAELRAPLVHDVTFRGRPAHIEWLAAMAEIGPLAIEVLQVTGGSDDVLQWASDLDDGYWHFVSYHATVDEAEASRLAVEASGAELVLSGHVGGTHFYMYDEDRLFGRMFEIAGGDLGAVEWRDHG